MENEGKYTIIVGDAYDIGGGKKRVSNSFSNSHLYFDTIEDCHRVIALAKPDVWAIFLVDDSLSSKEIEVSPLLAAKRETDRQEAEQHSREQLELVKLINSQPKKFRRVYGATEVVITRQDAVYEPKMSSRVRIWTSATIKHADKEARDLSLNRYQSSDGRVLRQGFLGDFGNYTPDAGLIAGDLKGLLDLDKAIKRGEAKG